VICLNNSVVADYFTIKFDTELEHSNISRPVTKLVPIENSDAEACEQPSIGNVAAAATRKKSFGTLYPTINTPRKMKFSSQPFLTKIILKSILTGDRFFCN